MSPEKLTSLVGQLPAGVLVRRPYPHEAQAVTGQGVALTGAGDAQALGTSGAGITVGVIDLGFASLAASQASGDLPANLTLVDYTGTGTGGLNHGTQVAEIVHEMAPGAALYLAKIDTEAGLGQAVDDMIAAGVDVIVHSVAWFGAAFYDGTGSLCDIAYTANQAGVAWANSAGNYRLKHYLGMFSDTNGDLRHEFAVGQNYNTIYLTAGSSASLVLNWDAYPTTTIDYNLLIYNGDPAAGGTVVASSANQQSGKGPQWYSWPYESLTYTPTISGTYYIVVNKTSASIGNRRFTLFSLGPDLSVRTNATSVVQPADCSSVFAVAATDLTDVLESFSSEGPTTDGRAKPDIAGPDRVRTSLSSSFAGTSASAPHVSGALALVLAGNPGMTSAQAQSSLIGTAKDVGAVGYDYRAGYGRISIDADNDGYSHDADNCPLVANLDQADMDSDGLGDACDNDIDEDGLLNSQELTLGTNPRALDSDGDGLDDGYEVNVLGTDPTRDDTDNDGLLDAVDPYPLVPADGDVAPLGAPDSVVNAADYAVMQRIVLGQVPVTTEILGHGDLYPPGAPDGVIDLADLVVLRSRLQ